jgi:nucleoid-associated protein YgaU
MGRLVGVVRFLVGAAMVAGGVSLVMPFGRLVMAGLEAAGQVPAVAAFGAAPAVGQPAVSPPPAEPAPVAATPQAAWMVPDAALPPPVELRGDYAPPPPPERLPTVPASLGAEGPGMNGTYRSTLAVPPPPLLDAHAPPPAAAAAMAEQQRPAAVITGMMAGGVAPPAAYVIRDGDDLTGISVRFYGHPAAAGAVWQANRDVIPDPALLPIGATLRMPPPWSIPGLPGAAVDAGRSIEPPPALAGPRLRAEPTAGQAWLAGGAPPPPAETPRPPTGSTVRLAPGETLESLAIRFYGDRSAANRIWEANRDRLRSPELAVTGMELRLP